MNEFTEDFYLKYHHEIIMHVYKACQFHERWDHTIVQNAVEEYVEANDLDGVVDYEQIAYEILTNYNAF